MARAKKKEELQQEEKQAIAQDIALESAERGRGEEGSRKGNFFPYPETYRRGLYRGYGAVQEVPRENARLGKSLEGK